MTTRKIEPGSLLHGLLNSDFDSFLLYRYHELLKVFETEFLKVEPDKRNIFIDMVNTSLRKGIADNNRIIRDLQITIENENIKEGFVSLSRIKLNNLQSVNEKKECFISDLNNLRLLHSKGEQKRDEQLTADVIGLFCHLVNKSNLVPQNDRETADQYCERVCKAYSLPYTSSVRKSLYREGIDPADLRKLQSLIFPRVDEKTKDAITKYLNRK